MQIEKLDVDKEIEEAKARLRDELLLADPYFNPDSEIEFVIDVNRVQLFKNFEQAELIPILAVIHAIRKGDKETSKV